ncbi:hypothetical protein [Shewanella sp. TC10]|nr:hypothetical protein [Shewanella sp. TC10]
MKKSSYVKLRNERSKRLNNEVDKKDSNLGTIAIFVCLLLVLAYLLV